MKIRIPRPRNLQDTRFRIETTVIDHIDRLETPTPVLAAIVRRHNSHGVLAQHYETVEIAVIQAFGQALGAEIDAEVKGAWLRVIENVSVTMKTSAAELPPGQVTGDKYFGVAREIRSPTRTP